MSSITVSIEIANNLDCDQRVRIPAGTIFEAAKTDMGIQNVVIVQDYSFTIPAKGHKSVKLKGNCLNRKRAYPSKAPGRLTPFRYTGNSSSQSGVWGAMSTPRSY